MNDETTPRILREIQREIAEIREDRAMMIESLDRLDAAVNSLNTEMRTLRSQLDRLRHDVLAYPFDTVAQGREKHAGIIGRSGQIR